MLLEARMPLPSRIVFPSHISGPGFLALLFLPWGNVLPVSRCTEVQVCAQFCVLAVGITREGVESEAHTHCLVRKQDFLSRVARTFSSHYHTAVRIQRPVGPNGVELWLSWGDRLLCS